MKAIIIQKYHSYEFNKSPSLNQDIIFNPVMGAFAPFQLGPDEYPPLIQGEP
jgi:hypothetical protein